MGALISALANFVVNASVLKFIAFKVVMLALIAVVLPIILWNFALDWILAIVSYAFTKINGELPSSLYAMTGVTGWIASKLQLGAAISNVVSALATNLLIRSLLRI